MQESNNYRADIQGLRGIAVLLVVLYHLDVSWLAGGYIGVDIFFVISGYLITGHLIESLNSDRFNFAEFYARRVRRIIPASLFVLFCTMLVSCLILPPLVIPKVLKESIATALYLPNIFYAYQQTDYLAETSLSPLLHYWSLGVEEQFYFMWPLLLFICWRLLKKQKNYIASILMVVLLASFVGNLYLTHTSQPWAFFLVFTRAWELGVGGLLAFLLVEKKHFFNHTLKNFAPLWGCLGIILLGYCAVFYSEHTRFPGWAAALPVVGAAMVLLAGAIGSYSSHMNKVMSIKPLQYIGMISYSFYLWHWPVIVFAKEVWPDFSGIYSIIILFVISLAMADFTYRCIEQPFRHASSRFYLPAKSALIRCSVASVFIVLVAGVYGVHVKSWPLFSDQFAQEYLPAENPQFTNYVPKNLSPALRQVSNSVPDIYHDGCHDDLFTEKAAGCVFGDVSASKTYVLYGDSHAAQWFPALERYSAEKGIRLIAFTKSACPAIDVQVIRQGSEYTGCFNWRKKVIEKINQINPDVVIVSSYYGTKKSLDVDNVANEWTQGLIRMFSSLPDVTQVVVVGDTPNFPHTPAFCLSKNLFDADKCAEPKEAVLDLTLARLEEQVARDHHKHYIDMNNYLCTATTCGPIIGNLMVYRDQHHITVEISERLSDILGDAIDRKLATPLARQ